MTKTKGIPDIMSYFSRHPKIYLILQWLLLVFLVAVVAFTLFTTVRDIGGLRLRGYIQRRRAAPRQISPDQVQGWMTFRYLNVVFNLPAGYLKSSLGITDSSYPYLTVNALARADKIPANQLLARIQQAIARYSPAVAAPQLRSPQ